MAQADARRAVIDELSRLAGRVLTQRTSPHRWTRELRKAGGADADASTVLFLKERRIGAKQLHAVAFRTVDGRSRSFVVGTEQDKTRAWHVSAMAGGGVNDPHRERPWVNLAGWGWPASFYGGGKVIGNGCEAVHRVRLRFKNGVELEDTVDDRLVLFIADRAVNAPASVDILDSAGLVMESHMAY
jgi:hypothetical protein